MPSGKVHTAINITSVVFVLIIAVFVNELCRSLFLYVIGFLFGTFFVNPDLDIWRSDVSKRWKFLRLYWYPYTLLFKHRGYSHNIIIGPASRILYLLLPVFFFVHRIPHEIIKESLLVIFGIWLADFLHILLDKIIKN